MKLNNHIQLLLQRHAIFVEYLETCSTTAFSDTSYADEKDEAKVAIPASDDSYTAFVAEMWGRPGIDLHRIKMTRRGIPCTLVSLVDSDDGKTLYVNALELGYRKTFVADDRHEWHRDERPIRAAAFRGIRSGVDPQSALRHELEPQSLEAALQSRNDRFPTKDRRLVLQYEDNGSHVAFHLVSRVIRSRDTLTARSHFAWGERRTFSYEGLRRVTDVATGAAIPLREFIKGNRPY